MAVELLRQVTTETPWGAEARFYLAGADGDQENVSSVSVSNGCTGRVEPRYFWFTFYGQRYRSLAYIFASFVHSDQEIP